MPKKLAIGVITYNENTAKYLSYFWDSLKRQEYQDFEVLVFDNSDKGIEVNYDFFLAQGIKALRPEANLGFARAYNRLIGIALNRGFSYFMVVNPDTILEKSCLRELLARLEAPDLPASVSPKIRYWDFETKQKTNILDTCGIVLRPGLKFADLGQTETDKGQYDQASILGPSGAAGIFRLSALRAIARGKRFYDERMFMYKEDCDLAFNLYLNGFSSCLAPSALVYHHRSIRSQGESDFKVFLNRFKKPVQEKTWSFVNQHLIYCKYWENIRCKDRLAAMGQILKSFIFVLLFEPYLLKQYKQILILKKQKDF